MSPYRCVRMPSAVVLRAQENRSQWGKKFRGPLATDLKPTHITHDGQYLVELPISHNFKKVLEVKMVRRSNDMIDRGCDGCVRRHNELNVFCGANGYEPVIDMDRDLGDDIIELWGMKEPREQYRGQWRIVEKCEYPQRYKAGTMIIEQLP